MSPIVEIFSEDLSLVTQAAPFHWRHRWSKWYRIRICYEFHAIFNATKLQKHCLICNKVCQTEIKNAS